MSDTKCTKSYYWFYKVNQREMTTMKALSVYQ